MNLLVTGGLGFIGFNFIQYLVRDGKHKIINIDSRTYASEYNLDSNVYMFYDFLGLEHTRLGAELGWKIDSGTLQIDFSSTLASDKSQGIAPGTPCLVLDYNVAPKYDFDKMCY